MANDTLRQPFQLKHLSLKSRIMMTAHEPAYPEDGMPKALYRPYHVERARAGIGLTRAHMADPHIFELKPHSSNGGEVNYDDLIVGRPQAVIRNADDGFQLFRIGDAVEPRNTHAAIYDALRLVKDL